MTDDTAKAKAQPVDDVPAETPQESRSFADEMRSWLREHEAEARAMLGKSDDPVIQTINANPGPTKGGDYSSGEDVDTSKPHYRHVLADGTDVLMGPDCAVPTHHGDDAVPVVASYLVPARSTN